MIPQKEIEAAAQAINPGAFSPIANFGAMDDYMRTIALRWKEDEKNKARSIAWVVLVAAERVRGT